MADYQLTIERFLQLWLAWRRESLQSRWRQRLWFIVEWIAAWMLIIGFSIWYLWEYVNLNASTGSTHLTQIPATTVPQNRTSQRKPFWEESFMEFQELMTAFAGGDVHGSQGQLWISTLRRHRRCRELASILILHPPPTSLNLTDEHQSTISTLERIWPDILELPKPLPEQSYPFKISLIIPLHNVSPRELQSLLQHTERFCREPEYIQIIVITAGDTSIHSKSKIINGESSRFQTLEVYSYQGNNGRGGCLNFGASFARGAIMTFLHSDTLLPEHWDQLILEALLSKKKAESITTLCAFAMGIDMTPFDRDKSLLYPWGLWGADHVLGYLRCTVSRLPYGDSVLSMPAYIFDYLGGYPEQPLMEDYDLVQLVRRRALHLPEQIRILDRRIACSPRRWQHYGVPYVIMANAYCIYRYKILKTPAEDIFEFYYHSNSSATTKATAAADHYTKKES